MARKKILTREEKIKKYRIRTRECCVHNMLYGRKEGTTSLSRGVEVNTEYSLKAFLEEANWFLNQHNIDDCKIEVSVSNGSYGDDPDHIDGIYLRSTDVPRPDKDIDEDIANHEKREEQERLRKKNLKKQREEEERKQYEKLKKKFEKEKQP